MPYVSPPPFLLEGADPPAVAEVSSNGTEDTGCQWEGEGWDQASLDTVAQDTILTPSPSLPNLIHPSQLPTVSEARVRWPLRATL